MSKNERDRLCLIVNPRSAGGATGRKINALRDAAARNFTNWEVRLTSGVGHATELAAQSASEGFTVVAAVGGDGTANEVVNGLFDGDRPRHPEVVFTVVPAGTGSDLIKSLKIPTSLDAAMAVAASGEDRRSDTMIVSFDDPGSKPRICINVVGFGVNGEVVSRVNASNKRFGGTATFFGATLQTLAHYTPPRVVVEWVSAEGRAGAWEGDLFGAFLANGHYCGGGMYVGRGGSMQDGIAELTIVPKLSLRGVMNALPRIYSGTLDKVEGVERIRVASVSVRAIAAADPIRVDVDGEQPGVVPAQVRVLPGSLLVRGQW